MIDGQLLLIELFLNILFYRIYPLFLETDGFIFTFHALLQNATKHGPGMTGSRLEPYVSLILLNV